MHFVGGLVGQSRHVFLGILCMIGGTSIFAAMDALVKWLVADHSVVQVLFFRSVFGLIPLLPLILRGGRAAVATRRPAAHAVRSLVGLLAIGSFFYAFGQLPLAEVTAIAFAAPLIMTALSVPFLGETVGPRRWAAVVAGFLAVLVIVRPQMGMSAGAAVALLGTVLYAVVMVLMRRMSQTEKPVTIVFWFSVTTAIVSGLALPWAWTPPTPQAWGLFLAAGILGGSAQLLVTQAVRLAPVSVVAPFDYLHIVWAVALGWSIWGDVPTVETIAGACVIAACGLYVLHRETMRKQSSAGSGE